MSRPVTQCTLNESCSSQDAQAAEGSGPHGMRVDSLNLALMGAWHDRVERGVSSTMSGLLTPALANGEVRTEEDPTSRHHKTVFTNKTKGSHRLFVDISFLSNFKMVLCIHVFKF